MVGHSLKSVCLQRHLTFKTAPLSVLPLTEMPKSSLKAKIKTTADLGEPALLIGGGEAGREGGAPRETNQESNQEPEGPDCATGLCFSAAGCPGTGKLRPRGHVHMDFSTLPAECEEIILVVKK